MVKKSFLCIIFIIHITAALWGQESKNTISGGINISGPIIAGYFNLWYPLFPGINFEFERLLSGNFAIAADAGIDLFILPYAGIRARWYTGRKIFYADIGLGIMGSTLNSEALLPVLSSGIGWKIDIGEPGSWVLMTGISERIAVSFYLYDGKTLAFGGMMLVTRMHFSIGYSF